MNFTYSQVVTPLKVLVTNPLSSAAKMLVMKIMSGQIFGSSQLIDLILLVYLNEKSAAENYKLELNNCAFGCMNTIEVISEVPCLSDADVFCFITTLRNPNSIDLENIDDNLFDALYLIIKIANNLLYSVPPIPPEDTTTPIRKRKVKEEVHRKPIIIADGLVALDILNSLSHNIPSDLFFCPTPLTAIAKTVLLDYLKVRGNAINNVYIWAVSDELLHVEVEKPFIIDDKLGDGAKCAWTAVRKGLLESSDLDHTQFNESWMKKEYVEKIQKVAIKNPYGCIYRASVMAQALKSIWNFRMGEKGTKFYCSLGVISDGSTETLKGIPYILPLVFENENWTVYTHFKESPHVRQEIKRFNKAVQVAHKKLITYCKKFLQDNVINLQFVPITNDSSVYSFDELNTSFTSDTD